MAGGEVKMHVDFLTQDVFQDYDRKISALMTMAFVSGNDTLSNSSRFGVWMVSTGQEKKFHISLPEKDLA
jgi:hypothetical protein